MIEAQWPGYVDLRSHPERASQLPEVMEFPELAEALAVLNADLSPVRTSKCDVWPVVDPADFDPDELDAPPEDAVSAMGCYIDLLPKPVPGLNQQWDIPANAAADCKRICVLLRAVKLRCCRVDLVVRRAFVTIDKMGLGITAYITACGPSSAEATAALNAALAAFAAALSGHSTLE